MFTLAPDCWFAWQMIPGYIGERCVPYCSPILVRAVEPKKNGSGVMALRFLNAMYAEGVQDFELDLRILKRTENYLLAELLYSGSMGTTRAAVISHVEFEWIRRFCPELWWARSPSACSGLARSSVSMYLNEVFLGRAAPAR